MPDFSCRKWLDRLFNTASIRRRPTRLTPRFEEMESRLTPAAPAVAAISRLTPSVPNITASSVQYTIIFDQSVTGVDGADFRVTTGGGATATPTISVSGNGPLYVATVNGIRGNGPIRLDLIDDDSIQNFIAEPLGGAGAFNGSFQGQSYNVLQAYPSVTSINVATPGSAATNAKSVSFVATFSTPVTGVDPTDFAIVATGNVGSSLTQVSPLSNNSYTVTVSGITGSGTLGVKLLDDGTIRDATGNPLTTTSAAATFSTQQSFATGANPHAVAVGDVNGDAKADLVVGNFTGNSVSVLLGNGTGAFQGQKTFAAGTGPSSVALADVNGDGKFDVIVANSSTGGPGNLGVLLGNGDGSFQGQTTFAVGTYPAAVRATDLNGDGKPDLASANRDGSVSVLLGNGNGSFKPQTTFAANTSPNSLAVADVNGDARPDLVVANRDSADVSVLLGNGDGSFQKQTTFAVGVSPRTVAAADVNGDNLTDLVVANRGVNITSTSVGVLLGNGDGTFQSQITYAVDRPYAAAVADINGDGKPDAVTFYRSISQMSALLGNGDGSFQSQKSFATVGSNPYALAVADLNGDGKVDLVTANSIGNSASVLVNAFKGDVSSQTYTIDNTAPLVQSINRGTPAGPTAPSGTVTFVVTFNEAVTGVDVTDFALATTNSIGTVSQVTPVSESVYNVTVSDATVTGTATTGTLGLNLVDSGSIRDSAGNVLINPNAPAAFFGQLTFATGANPRLGAVGDVNGDGKPDLVVVNVNANSISLLLGNGGGTFQAQATFATGGTALSAALGDVNGDGKLDIAFANYTRNSVNVLLGNGNGTFQAQQTFAAGVNPTSLAVADFNGDGKTDVAASNNASSVSVLLGNGNGAFQAPQSFGAGPITRSLVAGDVNSDGKADLVVANFGNNTTSVLLGNGNGSFQAQKTFATGTFPLSVAISDLNGDGKPDLAVANRGQNNVGILLGNGDGGFQAQKTFATGVRPYSVAVGDLNGDGKLDLAAANQTNNSASILFGNGNGTFQGQQTFAAGTLPSGAFLNDLNSDGKLDLAIANGGGDSVGVLLGNGTTIFTTGQTYTISAPNTATTTTLAASPASPQPFGAAITLTATITPAGAATGRVQFKDGAANLGTPQDVTLVGGVPTATLTTTAIGAGTRSLTAVYLGSGDFRTSTSNVVPFVLTPLATTTTLVSNPNPSTGGTVVTFVAIVAPNPGTHGTVVFKDNGVAIGTAPVVEGIASFPFGTFSAGQHPITATFSGDDAAGYAASTSNTLTQTVSGAPTTTTLSAGTPNPAGIAQAITFTVTVAGGGPTNGESVKLLDFNNAGAEVPVTGNVLAGGTATLTVAAGTFAAGTHNLAVIYPGNNFNSSSLSNFVTQTVGAVAPAPTVVSVTVNGNLPSLAGPRRSRVASIVVVFDRAVQLDVDAMTLALHTNGVTYNGVVQPTGYGSLPTALALISADKVTWSVTFTGNTDDGADGFKSLKDGVYDFVINGAKVHPDGVPGISMAANSTTVIHRLFGDANAPATPAGGTPNVDFLAVVNTGDNLAFRGAFNNAANYKAYFDFNGDGVINSADNLQFRIRFNKALTWKV